MRIRNIRLENYKRFTELTIADIPDTARLVVLVGPNGTGKSSVFDSFLLKASAAVGNYRLSGNTDQYYERVPQSRNTHQVASRVSIEFHDARQGEVEWKSAFHVRSAYRNESDFRIQHLRATSPEDAGPRLARIIDPDTSVSKNYERMAWKRMQDLDQDAPEKLTIGEYRRKSLGDLQKAMGALFSEPSLSLQDFGGIQAGSFRISKGNVSDFHYKNLSGGEKAVFDVLLDVFLNRDEAKEAVFCIDEPELHVATGLQGPLIASVLELLQESSQLWIATHSIGIVREAYRMLMNKPGEVVFLDFSGRDFDGPVTITPSTPNRMFWKNMYEVALDDLSSLVAPHRVVICEGSKVKHVNAFDARCYNQLFASEFPETLFISQGGSGEVIQSEHLVTILKSIACGIDVQKLIDRDDMTDKERARKIMEGFRVLRRRELEEYLYDAKVLRTFLQAKDCENSTVEAVMRKRESLLTRQLGPRNIKEVSRNLFAAIRSETRLPKLGNNREEFALQYLVPALRNTQVVYQELREDVFGSG
ncbi:MAG: AAA family ATPase [Acidobacteria bacterium]|nr:AAA family ATPase [Acidobacteriota bacterium]